MFYSSNVVDLCLQICFVLSVDHIVSFETFGSLNFQFLRAIYFSPVQSARQMVTCQNLLSQNLLNYFYAKTHEPN